MPNFLYYGQLEYGHMNVGITLFQIFKKRYGDQYKIFFIVNENWHKRLKKIDPSIETLLLQPIEKQNTDQIDEEDAFELLVNSFCKCKSLEEQCDTIISTVNKFFLNSTNYYRLIQTQIEQFFKQIDFQLILVDSVIPVPFLMNKNIPCVSIVSMSCAGIGGYDNVPPSCSMIGFKEKHLWPKRKQEFIDGFHEYIDLMNKYLEDEGVNERLKPGCFMFAYPDLNIYLVPEEISYISNDKRDAIEKPYPTAKFDYDWIRIDSTIDSSSNIEPFELPKWFLELPDVLGGMPHKFIVSTGENGYRLKLPENCYGSSWLPQKSVLKVCDMMITHGGNNSLTECFHYGVPMLTLPLFVDQLNNGTRLEELGYGYKVDIFDFDPEKLKEGINKVLNDEKLKQKMIEASKRIQNNNGIEIVCNRLIEMAQKGEKKSNCKS